MYKLLVRDLERVASHTLIRFACESHANCMLATRSRTAAGTFAPGGGKRKRDDPPEPPTPVKRRVATRRNRRWCQRCARRFQGATADSPVADCHFSAGKSNCDYCTSLRHQCVPVCAHAFRMTFADYSQVPPNCDQSLAAVLAQARLLHTGGASAPTEDSVRASARVLSRQMTASARSSDPARAPLSSAAGADPVTGADVRMLVNAVRQFAEVVATAVSMPSACESPTCH